MVTPGGIQKATIINESGLYSLILSSKLENALHFFRDRIEAALNSRDYAGHPTIRRSISLD